MSEYAKQGHQVSLRRLRVPSWTETVSVVTWVQVAVVAGLLLLTYWGEIRRLTDSWSNMLGDWTHGWLIPPMSLYIVHINRERLWRIAVRPNLLGVPIMLFAAAMYLGGIYVNMAYARSLSFLFMVGGMVWLMGGWRLALAVWFPIAMLVFAIPLPSLWYTEMTFPLRQVVTMFATGVLKLLPGVDATREATVIDYTRFTAAGVLKGQISVEEACSGMRLLVAFLAMGAIMAYLMREKPVWHRLTLLALCVPIAIFCNFVRVTTTGLLQVYQYRTLAEGGAHAALGLLMMVLALGLFTATNWMLSSLVSDAEDTPDEQEVSGGGA